jgi:hypothetical protein
MKKISIILLLILTVSCNIELGSDTPNQTLPTDNIISGNITETMTLTSDREWILKGYVYVTNESTLIIEAGTVIKSDISEKGALCIERGSKIQAIGTSDKPIIFTSGKPIGERTPGDWGGIVILGKARTNRMNEPIIEGGIGRLYGGDDDLDNSGIMKYVRIEYAGIASMPNSEINALTLAGVGSSTVIENIQTIYANDDAFEFFGGTVSPKYLYAYASADDDFDFDFGYTGTVSNSISNRIPSFVDSGDAGNGIESDNDGVGSNAEPTTHPKLYDVVLLGPNSSESLPNHNFGMRFRRGSKFTVVNSVVWGWMKGGISLESTETVKNYKDGNSTFELNQIGSYIPSLNFISKSTEILTNNEFRDLALINNVEIQSINDSIIKPIWSIGWTRFPEIGY